MPLEISCPGCNRRMSVPEAAAGRQVRCPACQTPVLVPVAAAAPAPLPMATPVMARPAPAVARPMPQVERWTLLTEDQQQFGPISRPELDQWYAEGRITQHCQLLREGGAAWQWAVEIYPALANPIATAAPANAFDFSTPAANPYAPSAPTTSKVSKYARRSVAVDYVSYTCFGIVGLVVLRILMAGLMQADQMSHRFSSEVAGATLAIYYVIAFFFALIVIVPYGLAGMAVSSRKQWGRILCLVAAGFSVLFGLLTGIYLLLFIVGYAAAAGRIPDEAHGILLFQMFLDGLMLILWISHALSFIVLLNSKFAKEFR